MNIKEEYERKKANREARNKNRFSRWLQKSKEPLTLFTAVALTVVAVLQWCTLEKTDDTLKATLAANRLSQRPWISVEIKIAGPLSYSRTDGARIPLEITIQNTGNEPALDVLPVVEMYGERIGRMKDMKDIIALLMTGCEEISSFPIKDTFGLGEVLMPKQTRIFPWTASMTADEVKIGMPFGEVSFLPPIISGCISYSYNKGEGGRHRTTFSYSPRRKDSRVFYVGEKETPVELMNLEPWLGRLFYAN
jgi:hypothetical protein